MISPLCLKPWMIYAAVFTLWSAGLSVYAFRSGQQVVYAKIAKEESRYMNEINKKNVELQKLSAQLRNKEADKEIVFQTIEKEVIRYVKNVDDVKCFNDDGMQLIKNIASGKLSDPKPPINLVPGRIAGTGERYGE